jgi:two-component system, NarL family, sensor histidine kinase BarA
MRLGTNVGTKFVISLAGVLILLMAINMFWSIDRQRQQAKAQLREEALIIARQLLATRAFIAENQTTINCDSMGNFEFKHLNPAAVGRGIGDIMARSEKYSFKQTNLAVRNTANAPDFFEWEKLLVLKSNPQMKELYGEDIVREQKAFRYLLPLYYEASCLDCHGGQPGEIDVAGYPKEGKQVGDFAGALSIVVSMDLFEANLQKNIIHQITFIFIMVLVTISCMYVMTSNIITRPLGELVDVTRAMGAGGLTKRVPLRNNGDEIDSLAHAFNDMAEQLHILYTDLERKVADRTEQLTAVNQQLAQQQVVLREMNMKLAKADQMKSEFLASMSHELRTPLTAIIAFAELLLNNPAGLTETQKEYLEDILESGQQLLHLINDLLDYSKTEAGLMEIHPRVIDLSELVYAVERMLKPWAEKKEINITVSIEQNLPVVFGDGEKLKRVIMNLLANAIKFTPDGGKIDVTVHMDHDQEMSSIQISVADDGIGIKEEEIPSVFDAFWQAEGISRQYSGTGLGLSLVKSIVEKHGGRVWVQSAWGQGSTFYISLPL